MDEFQLKRTADLLVSLGLAAAGYRYLNVDDCWWVAQSLPSLHPARALLALPPRLGRAPRRARPAR